MNAATISSLVTAIVALAGAGTAYLKSRTTQSNLDSHTELHAVPPFKTDYTPEKRSHP